MKSRLKELNQQNWLEADRVSNHFVKISPEGIPLQMGSEEWLQLFLAPKLINVVPQDVQDLFAVARGAILYGYFFYPLYTLGVEQLYRGAETAISEKCKVLGLPKSKKKFSEKIKWLVSKDIISNADIAGWNELRHLRNSSSHPDFQTIITPGMALDLLGQLTEKVNALFIRV